MDMKYLTVITTIASLPFLWTLFLGIVIGAAFGYFRGKKKGYQQAYEYYQRQQQSQMYAQYMNRAMGGGK